MDLKFEKITLDDYNEFLCLYAPFEEMHRVNATWKFVKPKWELFDRSHFKDLINDENKIFMAAKLSDEIVWFTLAEFRNSPSIPIFKNRKFMFVEDLVVKEEYRWKWIWWKIADKLEAIAKERWIFEIELKVRKFNEWAIKFYENNWYAAISQDMRKDLS